jgi:stage II sporulation protein D
MPTQGNNLSVCSRDRRSSLLGGALALVLLLIFSGCGKKATVHTPPKTTAGKTPPPAGPAPTGKTIHEPAPSPPLAPGVPAAGGKGTVSPGGRPSGTAPAALEVTGPLIRIGLTVAAREVRISAPGEFYLLERTPEATRRSVSGDVQVRIESVETSSALYRIQVASLSSRDSAESLRTKLTEALEVPGMVRENPASATFQVRIGEFETREEAVEFAVTELRAAGYSDYMVVRDSETPGNGDRRVALRGRDLFMVSSAGFLFSPSSASNFLRLDDKPYRGILEVMINRDGLLTVVNQLGVEEYLLGVVPAEISPSKYPEYAALAAQSIAARTYALKNTGRFRSEGFDLTADVRTQVYGGASQEREPTNEAVRTTAGLAIYYRGALIEAMYSSTCGGRTEDFAKVFGGPDVPYLKSVVCAVEDEAVGEGGRIVSGQHTVKPEIFTADGRPASRDLELAQVLGIPGTEGISEAEATSPPSASEADRWISQAAAIAGKAKHSGQSKRLEIVSRAGFITYATESIFGRTAIQQRISAGDVQYYLGTLNDEGNIPPEARSAFTFLMQAGLWGPFPDNSARSLEPITRVDGLSLLVRCIEYTRPEVLRGGSFAGGAASSAQESGPEEIAVQWGTKTQQLPLSPNLRLFRVADRRSAPIDQVRLIGGEKLRFHLSPDGGIDFLEVELNPTGTASDRFSPVASWKTTISAADLAERLRSLAGNIGKVRDVRPSASGESGRAVQMELVGSRGTTTVNGYKFRGALGLRDTLFTITRTVSPDGTIESFTFQGRGWGHGVGLCQVGAYGMARAGRTYEEILKTYYQGVEIRRAY